MRRIAALAAAAAILAGCGSHSQVVGGGVSSWPRPGKRIWTGVLEPVGIFVPQALVQLPGHAPRPLAQGTCRHGTIVELAVVERHQMHTIRYGPCRRPASIEELRSSLLAGYAYLQRPVPGAPPWLARIARREAAFWNDPDASIAVRLNVPGPMGRRVDTLVLRGDFVCHYACTPGLRTERDMKTQVLRYTYDAKTRRGSGSSLGR